MNVVQTNRGHATDAWVITGPPAAGKTTAIRALADRASPLAIFNVWSVTQAMLQEHHPAAEPLRGMVKRRDIFPDRPVRDIFSAWLADNVPAKHLVLDGYPKNRRQAADLFAVTADIGVTVQSLVIFDLPDADILLRATTRWECTVCGGSTDRPATCAACGGALARRADDAPDVLTGRIADYRTSLCAIGPTFARHSRIERINALLPREKMVEHLSTILHRRTMKTASK